jgi:transposase
MDTTTTCNNFTLLEIVDTGRRRRFSVEAKRQIVDESFSSGEPVSAVARRHGLFPAQLFAWRRAARDGAFDERQVAETGNSISARVVAEPVKPELSASGGRMEIVVQNGRRVVVWPDVDGAALSRVLDVLERRR